jgi:INO80 complex subunit C
LQSLAEQLSYLEAPRPFKNPNYAKKTSRRSKNLKAVLTQEREREKAERGRRRLERIEGGMDVDGEEEEIPTCEARRVQNAFDRLWYTDTSIEAPPSLLPPRHYCDITGLEVCLPHSCF